MTARISVLMPAYNCQAYVKAAVESIIKQSFEDWELLVADDFSSDNTRIIIDQFTDPRIRKVHNKAHLGVVQTRNKLIALATGSFIVWQDADDLCSPYRLIRIINEFEKDPDLAICGSFGTRITHLGVKLSVIRPETDAEIRESVSQRQLPFLGSSIAVKRSILTPNTNFRDLFHVGGEDPDWFLRLLETHKATNIPEELYYYRYNRFSLSRSISKNEVIRLNAIDIVFFLAEQRAKNHGVDGLMEGGDRPSLEKFIDNLTSQYSRDKSVAYRNICHIRIANHDYLFALRIIFLAILTGPDKLRNYRLVYSFGRSILKYIITHIVAE